MKAHSITSGVFFPEAVPDDVSAFIFADLNFAAPANRAVVGKQVEKVFVVDFDERALEVEFQAPARSSRSFLARGKLLIQLLG